MARGTFYDALGGIRAPRSASTGLRSTLTIWRPFLLPSPLRGPNFRAVDAGFYCSEAVAAYEKVKASFIIVARKTLICWKS
jgi:hypothetical protein